MSKTVELGRAVLDSPEEQLQLWFTTFITVSPRQDSINLRKLHNQALLELLLSSDTWVGRDQGMHIILELTSQGEPLGRREVAALAEQIVNAPVWGQLNLSPSLPVPAFGNSAMPLDHERLRINIQQTHAEPNMEARSPHRILLNVPCADVAPPEGVLNLGLSSIRLPMDIVKCQRLVRPTKSKRRKGFSHNNAPQASTREGGRSNLMKLLSHGSEDTGENTILLDNDDGILLSIPVANPTLTQISKQDSQRRNPEHGNSDEMLLDHAPETLGIIPVGNQTVTQTSIPSSPTRTPTLFDMGRGHVHNARKRKRPWTVPKSKVTSEIADTFPSLCGLETLIDAALRLVISNVPPKPASRVNVKANTFDGGLADIAPNLWSPGYLSSLSQRSHFLPILNRSVVQVASVRAKSLSLQEKFANLITISTSDTSGLLKRSDDRSFTKLLGAQLWKHTQKCLPIKTVAGGLLAFCAADPQNPSCSESDDDILDGFSIHVDTNEKAPGQVDQLQDTDDEILDGFTIHVDANKHTSAQPRLLQSQDMLDVGRKPDIFSKPPYGKRLLPCHRSSTDTWCDTDD
ncbi:hypothetical protein K504DRAFT_492600 [Pleomassaria siparia CBS 279.74]|uniref:Uncharacterized protein n=1 Tax=Pleomassaria siparia CBS 279.74 TaxID=1314801 RepID=A0A6G1K2L1_9PLEO|nr:hypothetical protein K504DRAFT_492600 [Pleomassaria siparia CBS 279.74]